MTARSQVNVERGLAHWLRRVSVQHGVAVSTAAQLVGASEIQNRLAVYPRLATVLHGRDWQGAVAELRQCWAVSSRMESIRLNRFVAASRRSEDAVWQLLDGSENSPEAAIDRFVDTAVDIAYRVSGTGGRDWAGAALLGSVLLTATTPAKYVDFRLGRWQSMARSVGYPEKPRKSPYGGLLVWAGEFASRLTQTATFQMYWPTPRPLWVLAGICWAAGRPLEIEVEPPNPTVLGEAMEGSLKWRLHRERERSHTLVRHAKERRMTTDPLLHCDVCTFSFVEYYGQRGCEFVEAHHRTPLSKLRSEQKTMVDDLALVCANCHRMLHREPLATVEQLRASLR